MAAMAKTSKDADASLGPIARQLIAIEKARSEADHFASGLESAVRSGPRGSDTIYFVAQDFVRAMGEVIRLKTELTELDREFANCKIELIRAKKRIANLTKRDSSTA
jgi:hypothetical protein